MPRTKSDDDSYHCADENVTCLVDQAKLQQRRNDANDEMAGILDDADIRKGAARTKQGPDKEHRYMRTLRSFLGMPTKNAEENISKADLEWDEFDVPARVRT